MQAELFHTRVTINQRRAELAQHLNTDDHAPAHLHEAIVGAVGVLVGVQS